MLSHFRLPLEGVIYVAPRADGFQIAGNIPEHAEFIRRQKVQSGLIERVGFIRVITPSDAEHIGTVLSLALMNELRTAIRRNSTTFYIKKVPFDVDWGVDADENWTGILFRYKIRPTDPDFFPP